jgi:Kef-type K+ transport system membrane component KefB
VLAPARGAIGFLRIGATMSEPSQPGVPSAARTAVAYGVMIAATAAAFAWIRARGGELAAPPPAGPVRFGAVAGIPQVAILLHVLLALVAVIVTARLLGALFQVLRQPPVIGEVIAGIVLGPSLLGRVAPGLHAALLPAAIAPHLNLLAQVGVILFLFLVGLELDTDALRRGTHTTIAISHASIVVPFLLGSGLALALYPLLSSRDVPFTVFALFLGVSMSVTAFPVLARILTDRGLQATPLGRVALTCAAVDDVTAWCLLALVVGVVQARVGSALATVGMTVAYIAFVILGVRPLVVRLAAHVDRAGRLTQGATAVLLVALLLSALATEWIGIHALFGAFLLGAIVPHTSRIARELTARLEDLVIVLFLPAFFAFTGMRTEIGLVRGAGQWLLCGAIVLVACLGKFGGTLAAARFTGLPWREAAALGVLMNTRGLMELVVLNLGLDLRVLSPTLFTMLVLMAVATTVMTAPVLHALGADRPVPEPAREPGQQPAQEPAGALLDLPDESA